MHPAPSSAPRQEPEPIVAARPDVARPRRRPLSYLEAAAVKRQAGRKARAAGSRLAGQDWRVLDALGDIVLSYCKLVDRVSYQQLERETGMNPRSIRAALNRLEREGIIVREAAHGRGQVSLLGFPPADPITQTNRSESAPLSIGEKPERIASENRSGSAPPPEGDLPSKEENPSTTTAREGENPELADALTTLESLSGHPIGGEGREALRRAWAENPAGVRRCIDTATRRKGKNPAGLLVRMVRDGDHRIEAAPRSPAEHIDDWCGKCDHDSRMVIPDDDGDAYRCEKCHPYYTSMRPIQSPIVAVVGPNA